MKRRTLALMSALLLVASACEQKKKSPEPEAEPAGEGQGAAAEPATKIDYEDPEACASCHAAVHEEWAQSMHSRAHHDVDPIYGSMRKLRMKKQGEEVANKCVKCHNPRAPEAPDSPAGKAAISCAACHNVAEVHTDKGVGVDALVWGEEGEMRSARDVAPGASPVHGTGKKLAAMADGKTLCLACHDATKTPSGAPACTTGPELAKHAGEETCVSCHMPEVEGPSGAVSKRDKHRSHAFLGPHRAWYQDDKSILEQAADLEATFQGGKLEVKLTNKSAHGFPSGFPGRVVLVKVEGADAGGEVVWRNFEDDPMAEHPESVLNKVYVDAEGKPVPAPFSKELKRDSRLKPDEVRTITYEVPGGVTSAKVSLVYMLLPGKLAKVLGIADAPEAKPKVIKTVEVDKK